MTEKITDIFKRISPELTIENLSRAVAPIEEHKVRQFMKAEEEKYRPNVWWYIHDWSNKNFYIVLISYFGLVAVLYAIRTKTDSVSALIDAIVISAVLVAIPMQFISAWTKGPGQWRGVPRNLCNFLYREDAMVRLWAISTEARWDVMFLNRTNDRRSPRAIVVWLVYPREDGKVARRGVVVMSSSPVTS